MARRGDAVRNEPGFLSFHKIIENRKTELKVLFFGYRLTRFKLSVMLFLEQN